MSKRVCRDCFADLELREFVNTHGTITSRCEWCGSTDVPAVGTPALGDAFRRLADLYVPTGSPLDGDPIEFLIQEDWEPFVDRIADDSEKLRSLVLTLLESDLSAKELSEEIDFEGGFARESESLTDSWTTEVNDFLEHRTALGASRSSLTSIAADSQLGAALEDLAELYSATTRLYRARIHRDRARTERFELNDLVAPPPDRAPSGRANRKGQPVLYLASDATTAVAEVRGWVGMAIAVAQVTLRKDARLVDLRNRPPIGSPFFDDMIPWRVHLAGLLQRWGDDLARPVMPHEEDSLYIPSQRLCDAVKAAGYEGVAYPSGLGPGHNVVLFDVHNAEVQSVEYVRVTAISHDMAPIPDTWPVYEEVPYDIP